ncbi:hypothetical protein NDU88_007758 [Pleurodeles waltl]|uniref:Uncharacterized protein n=1 Tax=Pleurodeles waltl TaxID=8319 RepID=A0AAV7N2X4_PLEWA|nr:hypothetical protein NDU88_007758 [Pleurodeles waltl]
MIPYKPSSCDRESPRVGELNGLKSTDQSLQSPRGASEGITSVCIREHTDIGGGEKYMDQEHRRDRLEGSWHSEGENQHWDEEEKTPPIGETEETRPRNNGVEGKERTEAEKGGRSEGARRVAGGTWLVQVRDRLRRQITPVVRRVGIGGGKVWIIRGTPD